MIDRPEPVALLTAMAATLSEQVVPTCVGAPQHAARVVANLCRILAREFEAGRDNHDLSVAALQELLGSDEPDLVSLVAQLDANLMSAPGDGEAVTSQAVFSALAANVDRRLAVAKPDYR